MQVEDIVDYETLEAWLQDRPQADSILLASRAALRLAPQWFSGIEQEWAGNHDLTSLPILRSLLISVIASKEPTVAIRRAAQAATLSLQADLVTAGPIISNYASYAYGYPYAHQAGTVTLSASNRAGLNSVKEFAAISTTDISVYTVLVPDFLVPARGDCGDLEAGRSLDGVPVWWDNDNAFEKNWIETQTYWSAPQSPYSFWLRWYAAALQGNHFNLALERDIALIPDAEWNQGPKHIATLIAKIELDHAIAATPNGEIIAQNPETGLLRILPSTDLPADLATYVRRKILKAVAVFGASVGNQYSALSPDLDMLREAANDPDSTPVELFDACASAARRLSQRCAQNECPSTAQDPLVADYAQRILDIGTDILGNDPQAQDVLQKRNSATGNTALIERHDALTKIVAQLIPLTEGRLQVALTLDVTVATNPAVNAEDRKEASLRTVSRIARIARLGAKAVSGTGKAITGTSKVLDALATIQGSPLFQPALRAILRYIGY